MNKAFLEYAIEIEDKIYSPNVKSIKREDFNIIISTIILKNSSHFLNEKV